MFGFLSTVKESMDGANAAVNARVNEALQSDKVKSGMSYLQGVAAKVSSSTSSSIEVIASGCEERETERERESDAGAEVEDWTASSSSLSLSLTHTTSTAEPAVESVKTDTATADTSSVVPATGTNTSSVVSSSVTSTSSVVQATAASVVQATSSAAQSLSAAIVSSTTSAVPCAACGVWLTIHHIPLLGALHTHTPHHACRMCARRFCERCVRKSVLCVPFDLLHVSYQRQFITLSNIPSTTANTPSTTTNIPSTTANIPSTNTNTPSTTPYTTQSDAAPLDASTQLVVATQAPQQASLPAHTTHTYKPARQYVCDAECAPRLVAHCLSLFRAETADKCAANFASFLAATAELERSIAFNKEKSFSHDNTQHRLHLTEFFPLPREVAEDSAFRQAMRVAHIADAVADYTGVGKYIKAAKYAYMGSEALSVLCGSDLLPVLGPFLQSLTQRGVTGPTALLSLYYLTCAHTQRYRERRHGHALSVGIADMLHDKTPDESNIAEKDVLFERCPLAVLSYVAQYVGPAQWLYNGSLPAPHDSAQWAEWYVGRLVQHGGWTLCVCVSETTRLPDGSKCPAFAVAMRARRVVRRRERDTQRESENQDNEEEVLDKEVLLVVRGSQSPLDWAINLDETLVPLSYTFCETQREGERDKEKEKTAVGVEDKTGVEMGVENKTGVEMGVENKMGVETGVEPPADVDDAERLLGVLRVAGLAHGGIVDGARALLDGYGVRAFLQPLLNAEFRLTVVGHSLGAGVAVLVAAELRSACVEHSLAAALHRERVRDRAGEREGEREEKALPRLYQDPAQREKLREKISSAAQRISAVVFSCPSIVSPSLAAAFAADRLLVQVLHDADAIPRLSHNALNRLARELCSVRVTSDQWATRDKRDLTLYAKRLGKAQDIAQSSATHQRRASSTTLVASESTPSSQGLTAGLTSSSQGVTGVSASSTSASQGVTTGSTSSSLGVTKTVSLSMQGVTKSLQGVKQGVTQGVSKSVKSVKKTVSTVTGKATEEDVSSSSDDDNDDDSGEQDVAETVEPTKKDVESGYSSLWNTLASAFSSAKPAETQKDMEMEMAPLITPPMPSLEEVEERETVSPGPIIHLLPDSQGRMCARVVTHSHATLKYLELLPERLLSDHAMSTYRTATHAALTHILQTPSEELLSPSLSVFPAQTETHCVYENERDLHVVPVETVRAVDTLSEVDLDADRSLSLPHTETHAAESDWALCSICELDVTWPYITHSGASRALAKHHCALCNKVVCVFCSPAGDTLPGDGLTQRVTLSDHRIAVPHRGIFTPQRVCTHCYFNSALPHK